jgi:hypothetical protein
MNTCGNMVLNAICEKSLQRQVAQLAIENETLKGIVKQRLGGDVKTKVLAECSS